MLIYYYTDPLAAAWMLEKHGMKFQYPHGVEVGNREIDFFICYKLVDYEGPYNIHPASLTLLEAKDGDLDIEGYKCRRVDTNYGASIDWYWRSGNGEHSLHKATSQTSIRDGKAFHWPESESC